MKILLFGKNGQVGWELNQMLPELGQVVAPSRDKADYAEPAAIRNVIRESKPDIIINAAAYTAVDKAEEEEDLAMMINGIAPGVLAEEARRQGALLVHYSTDYVFDGQSEKSYVETDRPNPVNVYGRSKLAGEKAIQQSGCNYLILRTSWVYSSRGSNFFLTMIRLARERDELNIVADQTGAPTWARLIAESTMTILRQVEKEMASEEFTSDIYHLTSRGRTSWFGFARQIFFEVGSQSMPGSKTAPVLNPVATDQYPTAAERPKNSSLDVGKLEKKYGLQLPEWDQSLHQFIQSVN